MSFYRTNDLDPGGDTVSDGTETTSQPIAIPPLENADMPRRCRFAIAGTANVWVTVSNGAVAVTLGAGILVTSATPVVLKTGGRTHFNHVASGSGSTISVTPLNE